MTELHLFSPPLARDKDPITSHKAAEKMVVSGALSRQEQEVYDAISRYAIMFPDFTTKDIAIVMLSMPYFKAYDICRKRFSGLKNKGKIKVVQYKYRNTEWTFIYKDKQRDGCRVWRLI